MAKRDLALTATQVAICFVGVQQAIYHREITRVTLGHHVQATATFWRRLVAQWQGTLVVFTLSLLSVFAWRGALPPSLFIHANLNLQDEDVSEKPPHWTNPEDFLALVRGANLAGSNLRSLPGGGSFLAKADLSDADLSWANLRDADLRRASLLSARLWQANLHGANLAQANLRNAILFQANLNNSDLTDAALPSANLEGAHLNRANLSHADLQMAQFWFTNLRSTIGVTIEQLLTACVGDNCPLPEGGDFAERFRNSYKAPEGCSVLWKNRRWLNDPEPLRGPDGATAPRPSR